MGGITTVAASSPRATIAFPSCSMPSQPTRSVRASSRRPESAACFARAALAPLAMASFWHTTRPSGRSRSAPTRNHSPSAFSAPFADQRPSSSWTARRPATLSRNPRCPPDRGRARGLPGDQDDEGAGPGQPQRLARLDLADPFLTRRHARDQRPRVLAPQLLDPVRDPVEEDDGHAGPGQALERGPRPLPSGQHHEHPVGSRLAQVSVHRLDLGPRGAPRRTRARGAPRRSARPRRGPRAPGAAGTGCRDRRAGAPLSWSQVPSRSQVSSPPSPRPGLAGATASSIATSSAGPPCGAALQEAT